MQLDQEIALIYSSISDTYLWSLKIWNRLTDIILQHNQKPPEEISCEQTPNGRQQFSKENGLKTLLNNTSHLTFLMIHPVTPKGTQDLYNYYIRKSKNSIDLNIWSNFSLREFYSKKSHVIMLHFKIKVTILHHSDPLQEQKLDNVFIIIAATQKTEWLIKELAICRTLDGNKHILHFYYVAVLL